VLEEMCGFTRWSFFILIDRLLLKIWLGWNQVFNPLRHATLLYAIYVILGKNPMDQEKCENAMIRLPFDARRHIHDSCVKVLFPSEDNGFNDYLFDYYMLNEAVAYDEDTDSGNRSSNAVCNQSANAIFRGTMQISKYVIENLKRIPYEYGRAMTKRQWRKLEEQLPDLDEFSQRIKKRHPEHPSEFWKPLEEAIEREKKREAFRKIFHI